jgi:hypothetical protein
MGAACCVCALLVAAHRVTKESRKTVVFRAFCIFKPLLE